MTMPQMPERPGNLLLIVLAVCTLADVIAVRPSNEGSFLISIGVFGALVSRGFLREPQSLMVCLLGFLLTAFSIAGNHKIVDATSGGLYVFGCLLALTYALWEKLLGWFSI